MLLMSDVSLIDVLPQLSALDAFKDKRPDAIDRQKLTCDFFTSTRRRMGKILVFFLLCFDVALFIFMFLLMMYVFSLFKRSRHS